MKIRFIIFLFCLIICNCKSQQTGETMKDIENILLKELEKNKTPSVQYIIFDRDDIIYKYQSGFSNIDNQSIVNDDTTYNAFSVTKTFTALAILQLAEKNLLNINNPVKDYWADFPYSSEITIKHILTHSAGIPNPIPLSWIHLTEEHLSFEKNTFFQEIILKNNKEKSKPNVKFAYSNLGYYLLGVLIEIITGQTYEDYVIENIIIPLNINDNELDFTIKNSVNHATGYHKKSSFLNFILGFFINKKEFIDKTEGKWKSFNNFYVNGSPYGGLIGTPSAFVVYLQDLLQPNSILLTKKYKELLFTENVTNNGKTTGMCLSWFKGKLNEQTYFSHAGGGGGYYCEIRIYPELGIGSVIMFNRTGMSDERYLDKLDILIINGIKN